MNQLVDTVRVLQSEKAELEISVHQLRAEQEKKDLDSKVCFYNLFLFTPATLEQRKV